MKELIILGKMDHTTDNSYESRNRVYSRGGAFQRLLYTAMTKTEKL